MVCTPLGGAVFTDFVGYPAFAPQNLENTEKHKIKNKIISPTLLCTQSLSHA